MALVSPGAQITINNQSQFVSSNVGSIPLVVLATAQDKQYNGTAATGTSKANAGKLQSFTSQRDLITALGTPTFQLNATGTPINASEINEYGLLTAYSALGLSNQLFAIRADIDLNQLIGTSVRPVGTEPSGTQWLNTASTEFGIYSLNAATNSFGSINPVLLKITDPTQVTTTLISGELVSTPLASVGTAGSYALVFTTDGDLDQDVIRLFYKSGSTALAQSEGGPTLNSWVQVNSTAWQYSVPSVTGTAAVPLFNNGGGTFTINGTTVNVPGTPNNVGVGSLVAVINSLPGLAGVRAHQSATGQLVLFASSAAASNGATADGKMTLVDGVNSPLATAGITARVYSSPVMFYGNYAQTPAGGWFSTDTLPKPTGSIWWKTSSIGTGWNPIVSKYSASANAWAPEAVPMYNFPADAIYGLDPISGGANIPAGQVFALNGILDTASSNSLNFLLNNGGSTTVGTGGTAVSFAAGQTYTIQATAPGLSGSTLGLAIGGAASTAGYNTALITTSGTTAASFVSDILNANIPYVTAQYNTASNTISITHTAGGFVVLTPVAPSNVLANAGIGAIGSSATIQPILLPGQLAITNFAFITSSIVYSTTTPYANPANGTLWYYSNPADVDIMINDGSAWKGYHNVTSDVRGYPLNNTDPNGVIVTATTAPTSQTDATPLVAGDIWLDSGNLANYPALYRYTGTSWVAIDNTDHVSNNGIVFADARWDSTGTTDPVAGTFPSVVTMLASNYVDQDVVDPRLYPRGTLLFNTRRSGYNVKRFALNYFNSTSFPTPGVTPGTSGTLPTQTNTWVNASGLNQLGVMNAGAGAQRALVVKALQSAINSNATLLDANFNFNLLVAPGYPELIPSLVTLNDNRGDTGFIIGDSPMTLPTSVTEITNWNSNSGDYAGKGLATASPYLGIYYPAGLTTDLAGNTVAVPASHAALRTYLYNDQVSYPWFAPAGVQRGLVSNLNDIGYVDANTGLFVHNSINQGMRDALYTMNINPIAQIPSVGLVIWGQETRSGDSSARSRVNVVRLENYLRVIFSRVSNGFLFEPNDTSTRKAIATQIEGALHSVLSLRGLYDFAVVCDTSNNTSTTIANSQLYVDVAIEPMRDVEFIYIPIAIYNPGTISQLGIKST